MTMEDYGIYANPETMEVRGYVFNSDGTVRLTRSGRAVEIHKTLDPLQITAVLVEGTKVPVDGTWVGDAEPWSLDSLRYSWGGYQEKLKAMLEGGHMQHDGTPTIPPITLEWGPYATDDESPTYELDYKVTEENPYTRMGPEVPDGMTMVPTLHQQNGAVGGVEMMSLLSVMGSIRAANSNRPPGAEEQSIPVALWAPCSAVAEGGIGNAVKVNFASWMPFSISWDEAFQQYSCQVRVEGPNGDSHTMIDLGYFEIDRDVDDDIKIRNVVLGLAIEVLLDEEDLTYIKESGTGLTRLFQRYWEDEFGMGGFIKTALASVGRPHFNAATRGLERRQP